MAVGPGTVGKNLEGVISGDEPLTGQSAAHGLDGVRGQLGDVRERAGVDLATTVGIDAFTRFLSTNGPAFYQFPESKKTFTLVRESSDTSVLETPDGPVTPLPSGLNMKLSWRL